MTEEEIDSIRKSDRDDIQIRKVGMNQDFTPSSPAKPSFFMKNSMNNMNPTANKTNVTARELIVEGKVTQRSVSLLLLMKTDRKRGMRNPASTGKRTYRQRMLIPGWYSGYCLPMLFYGVLIHLLNKVRKSISRTVRTRTETTMTELSRKKGLMPVLSVKGVNRDRSLS